VNPWLADVLPMRRSLLRYVAAPDTLTALVLLPPGATQPPPAVLWIYPGHVQRDTTSYWAVKNFAHPDNLHAFAAAGYAVVIPSIPLGATPREDMLDQIGRGVLPLLGELSRNGLVDTDRLAVMGQSFGGYGALSLATLTDRFCAAISIAGFANLTSLYGAFNAQLRYTNAPHTALAQARFLSGSVIGIGATPWEEPERYWRNSPLSRVAEVNTPVLLVHGDLDYVPLQQSEEFFAALHLLGREARLVRLFGEAHGADGAANVEERWRLVVDWLNVHCPGSKQR
jgi:dipeptidyl aminopeptidase/acylaminoacyl peptidase